MQWFLFLSGGSAIAYYLFMKICYRRIAFASFFLGSGIAMLFFAILWNNGGDQNKVSDLWQDVIGIVFLMGILFFVFTQAMILFYGFHDGKKKGDYIMVLGAGLNGREVSTTLRLRLDRAIALYRQCPLPMIVSGGQGKDEERSEAAAMRDYCIAQGVPEKMILMEDVSCSTDENFAFVKRLLNQQTPHVLLVTNRFHMCRAARIGAFHGFRCECFASPVHTATAFNFYVREFFALWKTLLCHLFFLICKKRKQ